MKSATQCGLLACVLAASATLAVEAHATMINATLNSRDFIRGQSQNTGTNPLGYFANGNDGTVGVSGASNFRYGHNVVVGFLLPILDGPITSATFSITISGNNGNTTQVDLYGLNTTNPDGSGTSLFFNAETDGAHTELKDTFTTTATSSGTPSAVVTAFISGLYTGNTPNQAEVFFRLNPDRNNFVNVNRVTFNTATAALEIVTVPEPSSLALLGIGSLGLLIGLRPRRKV